MGKINKICLAIALLSLVGLAGLTAARNTVSAVAYKAQTAPAAANFAEAPQASCTISAAPP